MLKAEKLNVFIDSVISFFTQIGDRLEDIDTPYLNSNQAPESSDYTGIITITGPLQGCVYVSASSIMLREILKVMGEPDNSLTLMKDLVGEIANTVSGNARSEFGSEFIISPPKKINVLTLFHFVGMEVVVSLVFVFLSYPYFSYPYPTLM